MKFFAPSRVPAFVPGFIFGAVRAVVHATAFVRVLCPGLISGFAAGPALAQDARPLFREGIPDWTPLNTAGEAFTYEAGTLRVSGKQGWLRSPREYGDFELRGELRFVEPNSDSGIFLRVELNGELVTEAGELENTSGYIGFHSEAGIIEYPNMTIRDL